MKSPLVNDEFLLQKMPGKGGWTFAIIPNLTIIRKTGSMWVKVKGKIDKHQFSDIGLARTKDGSYFFPVKAEIRKAIQKQAGDTVKILLYEDLSVFQIPEEIIECLKFESDAYQKFMSLREGYQKEFIKWILSAKKDETRAARINITIDKLLKGERMYGN